MALEQDRSGETGRNLLLAQTSQPGDDGNIPQALRSAVSLRALTTPRALPSSSITRVVAGRPSLPPFFGMDTTLQAVPVPATRAGMNKLVAFSDWILSRCGVCIAGIADSGGLEYASKTAAWDLRAASRSNCETMESTSLAVRMIKSDMLDQCARTRSRTGHTRSREIGADSRRAESWVVQ